MTENKFIAQLRHKTDSELESIVENREKYNDQAVNASIEILKE